MVEIDPILKTYKIIEFAKKLVILTEGTGKDVKALQRKAKKSLVQLGAKFYDIIGNKKRILYYNG